MASRSLGTLTVDLVAKSAGFEQGMDKAARAADKRFKDIARSAKQIGVAIGAAFAAAGTALPIPRRHPGAGKHLRRQKP